MRKILLFFAVLFGLTLGAYAITDSDGYGNFACTINTSNALTAHATDCTAVTAVADVICYERDSNRFFVCEPSAGDCDTAGEWKLTIYLPMTGGTMTGILDLDLPLNLAETTTPTPDPDHGKMYTQADNWPYFQDGAGVEHVLLNGTSNVRHISISPVEDTNAVVGNWDVVSLNASGHAHFNVKIPENFTKLISAFVIVIPDATETIQWDTNISVATEGELFNADDRAAVDDTLAVTVSLITGLDISGELTGLAANDHVGINFESDTANIRVIQLEINYE